MRKVFSYLSVLSLIGILVTKVAVGAQTYGKLPKDVTPIHYDISINPDVKRSAFLGYEIIEIDIKKAIKAIVINSLELNITDARLIGNKIIKAKVKLDPKEQTATFLFPEELQPGKYKLAINYTGKLGIKPHGLFLAWQEGSTGRKPLIVTQLEATDARRMFPCWDEPAYKATFNLSAKIPKKLMAISNMPIESEEDVNDEFKNVKFSITPKMSTYLLVFVAGELEFISGMEEGVTIRVITPPGKKEKGRYALDTALKLLPFYNQYFGMKYPLPKLDLIAVPGGIGAMENWGGITFNEDLLLFDPKKSSLDTKNNVFEAISHEMAHQWFGNIVTMKWWDDLWLNEGLASWMEIKATDLFNPKRSAWLLFTQTVDKAMDTDSRKTTFPVERPVKDESQAGQTFDEITYVKAASIIRMLENYLGEEKFKEGVRHYLQAYQYSNAASKDLWLSFQYVTGTPFDKIVAEWFKEPGFPLVKIKSSCQNGNNKITLTQSRFSYAPVDRNETSWKIPISLSTANKSNFNHLLLLEGKEKTIVVPDCSFPTLVKEHGYFRVHYEPKLFKEIKKGAANSLSEKEKLTLLSDTWALVKKGDVSLSDYLGLVQSFISNSQSLPLWNHAIDSFTTIDRLAIGTPGRQKFKAQVCSLLRPAFNRLGWDKKPNEDENVTKLRVEIISTLGIVEDKVVINEAFKRFEGFLKSRDSLPSYLRPAVLSIVGRYGDAGIFNHLHDLGKKSKDMEEKERFYNAMLSTLNPDLAKNGLMVSLTDELSPVEAANSVYTVAYDGGKPELAWEFTKKHFTELHEKLPSMYRYLYVPKLFGAFHDEKWARELEIFAKSKLSKEASLQVTKATERIRFMASFKKRLLPQLHQWFIKNTGVFKAGGSSD